MREPDGLLGLPRYVTLDQLQRAYQEAQQGRSQALLIEGEPGIGKARLAEEFLAAAAAGATTLASLLHLRDLDEISNQTHLFQRVAQILAKEAEKNPVVIFIDDLQWAAVPSFSWLYPSGNDLCAPDIDFNELMIDAFDSRLSHGRTERAHLLTGADSAGILAVKSLPEALPV